MMPLTAALVISNRSLWEQVHACIQNLPVRIALEQNEPDDVDSLLDRIEKHRADVVLIEAHRLALPLEDFIGRLRDTASQPAVFVLHPDASPQHIMEAIRAGAAEFLKAELRHTACVILDHHMPGMTGLQLVEHLCAAGIRVPIMLITGGPLPVIAARAATLGIGDVLVQPPSEDQIITFINAAKG